MFKYIENGSITSVNGFKASGLHSGIKKKRKDLALIYSETDCELAATFTKNKFKAAPVLIGEEIHKLGEKVRAILINSGNANACTGDEGMKNAQSCQKELAACLYLSDKQVLVSSTGVIGKQLETNIIIKSLPDLINKLNSLSGSDAAEAIMTTDTYSKSYALEVQISGKSYRIGAIAKGSGMIQPNMATMLAFISTDIKIEKTLLQEALKEAVDLSFNRISVDGEMSTNDTVLLLANSTSSIAIEKSTIEYVQFKEALIDLCRKMAIDIVKDGEGSSKIIEINVKKCENIETANKIAERLANSLLIKTAIYGEDANWGRILSAIGSLEIDFNPDDVEIFINKNSIISIGRKITIDESIVNESLKNNYIYLDVVMNSGEKSTQWWTTDLTEKYIDINAHYRT
jgi:glutamate N-acetyltransferase / amino-acid N-acetyltransferase